jgi:hypothetical protein
LRPCRRKSRRNPRRATSRNVVTKIGASL